jgi:hydroxypyruvate reductase
VGIAELRALFERSLREGLDIEQLNRERIALSRVKGGGLAGLFKGTVIEALMISDVPRDDPAVLASGLLDTPGLERRLVGSIEEALAAVERAAAQRGLTVARGKERLAGDAEAAARRICHELAVGETELHIYGGETVVRLPEDPGRGGRCQHLAVAAARHLAGHADFLLLAAGTDGRDGASEDAGAIVDGGTVARAEVSSLDAEAALSAADSGSFLEATGDLVHTGPTGTNVGDIVLALRQAPPDSDRM